MVKIVAPLRDVGLLLAWSLLLTRLACAQREVSTRTEVSTRAASEISTPSAAKVSTSAVGKIPTRAAAEIPTRAAADISPRAAAEVSTRAAADREEQQLSKQHRGLSYQSIHRILRDENEPASLRGETASFRAEQRYQQQRFMQTRQKRELNAPANRLNLTNRGLRLYNSSSGQWQGDLQVITSMDLSNNRLSRLSIDHFQQLRQLDVSNNSLSGIPLSLADSSPSLPLVTLDLSCNRFSRLSSNFFAQRLPQLRHLNLAHNLLGNVSRETFYNLLELQTLLLSHNNISDIDYETFLALPNLQHLDLSHNRLSGSAIRALQGIPDLVSLSIAQNPQVGAAMQEFVASWSLKELDASGTGLCQVPAALAQSVRTLKLSDNWLKSINCGDMDSYPLLQYLDLSHSRIAHVEDDALGRLELLEFLFLDHNLLMRVPGSLPTSLEHLFLQHNQIMELPPQSFAGLTNLQTLDVSGNRLIFLPALALPKLLTLNLQSSGVESVSQSIVHTLPQLRDLLLEDNPIRCSDLLSIAEWASPCRVVDVGQPRGQIDLKQQFLQFHDFYENFGSQCGRRMEAGATEDDKRPPECSLEATAPATATQRTLPQGSQESKAQDKATTTQQSAGNNIPQLTTKTLRPTETTLLAKIQQRQQQQKMPGMPIATTTASQSLPAAATTTTKTRASQLQQQQQQQHCRVCQLCLKQRQHKR
ncbi:insulin-like growth factor-binding protein complex acid labile subunit [Drosophila subobscura]|uniref:insulin-like growth factor-binding protein complex acid labile subunit n=1 Tax=Drosophila subobscura TaxID=7241 RepID=UPI00155A5965|nr:insulin-like growth factor-binding protein complex acid labile subunit [Drosophila subobscura]XP_034660740.1 insulin-like growth factor-binding protein complex acid labile subunit [Drosophila subobscura]